MITEQEIRNQVSTYLKEGKVDAIKDMLRKYPINIIRDQVHRIYKDYMLVQMMDLYLTLDRDLASEVALKMIQKLGPGNMDAVMSLAILISDKHVDMAITAMGKDAPVSLVYVLNTMRDMQFYVGKGVSIDFLYHYIMRPDTTIYAYDIASILRYPPTITREKVYYLALQKYVHGHPGTKMSEIDILSVVPGNEASTRMNRIVGLSPVGNDTFPTDGCPNDMGLIDSLDEVPPILRYQIRGTGNTIYCLPVSDIYGMVMANNTRNPYTREDIPMSSMVSYLTTAMEQGYPIARSTASDFYDPITYDISLFDQMARIDSMVDALDLSGHKKDMHALSRRLGISPLAFQHVPWVVRGYSRYMPNIGSAISTPMKIVDQLHTIGGI